MLISVLIMAVFAVGAGILLFTTPIDADAQSPADDISISSPEDDIDSQPSLVPEPSPEFVEPPPPEEPVLQMEVTSVRIMYDGRVMTDFTLKKGETIEMRAVVEPVGIDVDIIWETSNPDVFEVVPVDVGGVGVKITAIANGNEKLILRAGDQEATSWVRVN